MSGHSKWSSIKHKKALVDQKRGKTFSRLSKLITIAAQKGLDPKLNPNLAQAISRARSENMPNINIERAINKAADKSEHLDDLAIEVLGPGRVALKIKAITDNKNRTISEVRKILGDFNRKIEPPGSLSWMFNSPPPLIDERSKLELKKLINALEDQDDVDNIITNLNK